MSLRIAFVSTLLKWYGNSLISLHALLIQRFVVDKSARCKKISLRILNGNVYLIKIALAFYYIM